MRIKRIKSNIVVSIFFILFITLVTYILFNLDIKETAKISEKIVKVTYLYVGQGDATLIRDLREGGKVMLIDGGPRESIDAVISYLEKEGIKSIDYIVVTHKHEDHIGGFPYIIRKFNVSAVFDNGTDHSTPFVRDMLEAVKEKPEVKYEIVRPGMGIPFGDDIVCQVLGPLRFYNDENNSSVVIRLTVGNVSFMFCGDIEIPAELDLISYGENIKTTVLKVPHHGSHSSSSKPFLDKVRPRVAVFSCGKYNKYGYPVFEIIRRYEERGSEIYRTDIHNNIEVITDGGNYKVITNR